MKVIIIDDEPGAIQLLEDYLTHFSKVKVVGAFRNGLKAMEYLTHEAVDLVFLDINMPHISGLALSKVIPQEVHVIFTTAYSEHAVASYEVQATDYLLKPISFERFTLALSRVLEVGGPTSEAAVDSKISIRSGTDTHRIDVEELLYLEKDGNYITYHCAKRNILARETINESLSKLPDYFIQCHKSFIINTRLISKLNNYELTIHSKTIPIGEVYRARVLDLLDRT